MNSRFYKFWLIIIIGLLFFSISCKQDDAPENPCAKSKEVKADFVIEELLKDRYFEGDTIGCCNKVRFRALQQADSYEWILGAETLRTQSFIRTNFPTGVWLDVSLKLKRNPDNVCFPYDDGIDSSSRKLYVWPLDETQSPPKPPIYPYYLIYGTYKGYNLSNPSLLFNVTLFDTFWVDGNNKLAYVGLVNGIPYKTSRWNLNNSNYATLGEYTSGRESPKALYIDVTGYGSWGNSPLVPKVITYAWLDRRNTNQITVEYSYADTIPAGSQVLKYHEIFIGQRIY